MGQEVKNPLRAQSKYGLMGSSAKTGKHFFQGSPEHFLDKMPFVKGHPPPTHQLQSTCVGDGSRVQNLQTEFNYLDSFKSYGIFSDFVVPMVPMLSPSSLRHPRVIPVVIPVVPTSSPWPPEGPHVVSMTCGLRCLRGLYPMLSPWSPCRPCHPQVSPVSSLSSPHHLEGPHIIPNPPDTHSTHPHPPGGWGAPNQ